MDEYDWNFAWLIGFDVSDIESPTFVGTYTSGVEATDHNVTRTAERLGLSRRGLQLKMKELGLRA